jgi:hypothetical protein
MSRIFDKPASKGPKPMDPPPKPAPLPVQKVEGTITIKADHLEAMYDLVKQSMDMKYKILDILYPNQFAPLDGAPVQYEDPRIVMQEKLEDIAKIVRGFKP